MTALVLFAAEQFDHNNVVIINVVQPPHLIRLLRNHRPPSLVTPMFAELVRIASSTFSDAFIAQHIVFIVFDCFVDCMQIRGLTYEDAGTDL